MKGVEEEKLASLFGQLEKPGKNLAQIFNIERKTKIKNNKPSNRMKITY